MISSVRIKLAIAGFHTVGAWVRSVYYGINNAKSLFRVNWANIEQDTAIHSSVRQSIHLLVNHITRITSDFKTHF